MAQLPPALPVYIVEDDEAMRDSLALLLELDGFEVHSFVSAAAFVAALELGRAGERDSFLILDVTLPGMSGIELLHRHRERLGDRRVVMMSGHAGPSEKARALALGARAFLDKPFAEEDLLAALGQAASGATRH